MLVMSLALALLSKILCQTENTSLGGVFVREIELFLRVADLGRPSWLWFEYRVVVIESFGGAEIKR